MNENTNKTEEQNKIEDNTEDETDSKTETEGETKNVKENKPNISVPKSNQNDTVNKKGSEDIISKPYKIIFIMAIVLAFIVGGILGCIIGVKTTENKYSDKFLSSSIGTGKNESSNPAASSNSASSTTSSAPAVDYTKYIINAKKKVTVDNFYSDDETKGYAVNVIGTSMPKFTWKTDDNKEHSTEELGKQYIIELISPTCQYCQQSISGVDNFRKKVKYKVVSLTTEDGDLSKFNKSGKNTFKITNNDSSTAKLMENIPYIPSFLYVQNGTIKLITFGEVDETALQQNADVAFT